MSQGHMSLSYWKGITISYDVSCILVGWIIGSYFLSSISVQVW